MLGARKLIKTENDYNFWKFSHTLHNSHLGSERVYWNITPVGSEPPTGGYTSKGYIEHIKHQTF